MSQKRSNADQILYSDDGIPRVPVRWEGVYLVFTVPCPYCRRRHYHGAKGGLGHRRAHCPDIARGVRPPGSEQGYELVITS